MAWSATLEGVRNNPVPTDIIYLDIKYTESVSGDSFSREYQFVAGNLQSLQNVRDFVTGELAKLDKFTGAVNILKGRVGQSLP